MQGVVGVEPIAILAVAFKLTAVGLLTVAVAAVRCNLLLQMVVLAQVYLAALVVRQVLLVLLELNPLVVVAHLGLAIQAQVVPVKLLSQYSPDKEKSWQ